jgi:hypothetical protein
LNNVLDRPHSARVSKFLIVALGLLCIASGWGFAWLYSYLMGAIVQIAFAFLHFSFVDVMSIETFILANITAFIGIHDFIVARRRRRNKREGRS